MQGRRVFFTRHSEYHFRDGRCFAVRDRRTGAWQRQHDAIGRQFLGGLRMNGNGGMAPRSGMAEPGERMLLSGDLITSPVEYSAAAPAAVTEVVRIARAG